MKTRHRCGQYANTEARDRLNLARAEAISQGIEGFPKTTPLGVIFDLLRKQPQLTPEQQHALKLWDEGECHKVIFVPRRAAEYGLLQTDLKKQTGNNPGVVD